MLLPVPHDKIDYAISKIRPLLERFSDSDINKNIYSLSDFIYDLKSGYYTLWLVFEDQDVEAYVTTQIWSTSKTSVCEINACCGSMGAGYAILKYELPVIEEWARERGCKYMYIRGRRGWKRMLKDYEEQLVILTKEL